MVGTITFRRSHFLTMYLLSWPEGKVGVADASVCRHQLWASRHSLLFTWLILQPSACCSNLHTFSFVQILQKYRISQTCLSLYLTNLAGNSKSPNRLLKGLRYARFLLSNLFRPSKSKSSFPTKQPQGPVSSSRSTATACLSPLSSPIVQTKRPTRSRQAS